MKIHPVFHTSLLKPYHESDQYPDRQIARPPPIIGDDIYLVERLLDKRIVQRNGRSVPQYLVHWKGYPIYDATWEPAEHLLGAEIKKMRQIIDRTWQTQE
jgi:hypothetical protein